MGAPCKFMIAEWPSEDADVVLASCLSFDSFLLATHATALRTSLGRTTLENAPRLVFYPEAIGDWYGIPGFRFFHDFWWSGFENGD